MQLPPQNRLSSIIKHYLFIENKCVNRQDFRLFSDGNPGIVFHFKNTLQQYSPADGKLIPQPASFVYGQITDFNNLTSFGDLRMLVVVLQPYALFPLFNVAASELNDSIIPLKDLLKNQFSNLEERVTNAPDIYSAINMLEDCFISKLDQLTALGPIVQAAISLIYRQNGNAHVANILNSLPITERQLERKFNDYVGVSPKRFIDIVRFQGFLKALQVHSSDKSVDEIVYRCGYYDQAHLNKYFKKQTGVTPMQYKATQNLLAINLMPV